MAKRKARSKTRKQNKKRLQSQGFIIPPRVITALTLIVMVSLSYVWLSNSREAIGVEITRLERELQNKVNERLDEEYKWSLLTSAVSLQNKLDEFGLNMTWPEPGRVIEVRNIDRVLGRAGPGARNLQLAEAGEDAAQ